MPWVKGQSGNPQGSPKGVRKQSNSVEALIKRGSKASLKLLCDVVEGKSEAAMGDKIRASQYLIDRDLGRVAAQDSAQGMFHGAQITVNTGFNDNQAQLPSPIVEGTAIEVNGHKPSDSE